LKFVLDESSIISDDNEEFISNEFPELLNSVGLTMAKDDTISNEIENENTMESELVGKKRRLTRIPRVFKSDIRRQYSTMVANVLNNSDYSTHSSFFRSFSTDSMMVKIKGVATHVVPKHITYFQQNRNAADITFIGKDWIRFHFFAMHRMTFDQVFHVKNARIVVKKNSKRSAIVMDTEVSFTQIYDANPYDMVDTMFVSRDESIQFPYRDSVESNSFIDESVGREENESLTEEYCGLQTPIRSVPFVEFSGPLSSRSTCGNMPTVEELDHIPSLDAIYKATTGRDISLLSTPRQLTFPSRLVIFLDENKYIDTLVLGNDDILNFSRHPAEIIVNNTHSNL
jgi:hypothetical protein